MGVSPAGWNRLFLVRKDPALLAQQSYSRSGQMLRLHALVLGWFLVYRAAVPVVYAVGRAARDDSLPYDRATTTVCVRMCAYVCVCV